MLAQGTLSKRYVSRLTQTRDEAQKHYQDKIAYVTKNMEQLQDTIHRKQDNVRVVGEVMQVVRCTTNAESNSAARGGVANACTRERGACRQSVRASALRAVCWGG